MSRVQDPQKAVFFPHGNPFRMMLPKGSSLSIKLSTVLTTFEETLARRVEKLKPMHEEGDVFSLSWMALAMNLVSETHADVKSLITELELPIHDWDDKWIDVYLDNSVKLLDICNGLSSEISRLSQGQLLLHLVLRNLEGKSSSELLKAKSLINSWRHHIAARNVKFENCIPVIDKLMESLELPKVKNSAKGKVLMRAMYGVKMTTVFVCSVFVSVLSGSDRKLVDLQVSGSPPLWRDAFSDLQTCVYGEITRLLSSGRNVLLKDVKAVDICMNELYSVTHEAKEPAEVEAFQKSFTELGKRAEKLSAGLDQLTGEVDGFFQIVMSGRDALLCNLRVPNSAFESPKKYKREQQRVR